jgi:subtilisin
VASVATPTREGLVNSHKGWFPLALRQPRTATGRRRPGRPLGGRDGTRRSSRANPWTGAGVLAVAALASGALALPAAAQLDDTVRRTAQAQPGPAGAQAPDVIPGAWIVVLEDGAAPGDVATEHGRRYGAEVDHVYRHAVRGYAARMSAQTARRVAADPVVAFVQADRRVTIAVQTTPTGINRIDGELSSTVAGDGTGAVNVDVAVIDTGIARHPDLNLVGGVNCSTGRSIDDGNGHGTHVAGTIGARDDTVGVVGVAPGARLHAVRVLNNRGSGSFSSIICGIDWVTRNADVIEVANMSLGGGGAESVCGGSDAMHNAICASVDAGVTYVVAAGNEAADAKNSVPASYDEVITVSALADFNGQPGGGAAATCRADVDDTFASFSNFGADVDVIAPGVCINSTWKGGGYNTISGTSMASPHVAGAAARYKVAHPGALPAQVQAALVAAGSTDWNAADDRDPLKEPLLNVKAF